MVWRLRFEKQMAMGNLQKKSSDSFVNTGFEMKPCLAVGNDVWK
jgi:hypothetical protein